MGRPCREVTGLFMSVLLWTCPRDLRTLLLPRLGLPLWFRKNPADIELDCAKQRLRLPQPWCDAVGLQHASPPPLGIGAPPVARSAPKFVSPTERISRR